MKPRTVAYLIVLLLLTIFVVANWNVIVTSTEINFLIGRIHAPLGLLIALLVAIVVVVDFIAQALLRYGWLRERRTLEQEIARHRLRAEEADQSRVGELRTLVEREFAAVHAKLDRALSGSRAPAA
jgi:uncharacterized integral membrane protein